jgi:hypothetical protein
MTKVEFDSCVRKAARSALTEFNVDERPLVCEGCRHSQVPSSFAKLVCPRDGDVSSQQPRSPALSFLDWLPVNHKDRSNRTTASRPARIADGDRSALLSRIAPPSGCRRCQRTHDRAVWGKSSWHSQAREQAGALRWRQLQARLSSEFHSLHITEYTFVLLH